MLRSTRFFVSAVVFLALWGAVVSKTISLSFIGPKEMLVVQPVRAAGCCMTWRPTLRVPSSRCAGCVSVIDFFLYACFVQLPIYLLVAFGCYSLAAIGINLFLFRDCPEASVELAQVCVCLCLCVCMHAVGWGWAPRGRV